ncbi:M64 family metallopeptidase [Sphingobacterium sp. IITKGP-BTPF85]|uniref:M64 family metallopeptidase n=1 Tax=Sphingobacterium sp. IITKGP-BTPF85 TaxID=1338009 RepID=UPI00038A234E|nr:M64 family metallopeptidase [Sphingobacterium sp. IITKGP-BTPF85]KKX49644.1 hypothetical protein L950_0214675 [Sphingobacterium sp. IITKGP-BTPF85]
MNIRLQHFLFSFIFLFLLFPNCFAQRYAIDTLQYQGTDQKVVNLVILGDGYTQAQLMDFEEDAKRFTDYFFQTEPFRQYSNYFNVFAIKTPSLESGAVHACTASDCVHGNTDLSQYQPALISLQKNIQFLLHHLIPSLEAVSITEDCTGWWYHKSIRLSSRY